MTTTTEDDVERAALDWLSSLGSQVVHGPDVSAGRAIARRVSGVDESDNHTTLLATKGWKWT